MTERHPDMRERKQITVKMTEQFAKDLNLVFASCGLTDVSFAVRQSVAAQANAIRARMARKTETLESYEVPGER